MGQMRRVTVELDAKAAATLDQVVSPDRFADAGEAIRAALAMLAMRDSEDDECVRTYGLEGLRALIAEGEASGDPIEATDEFFEDVKRRGRERMAQARAAE